MCASADFPPKLHDRSFVLATATADLAACKQVVDLRSCQLEAARNLFTRLPLIAVQHDHQVNVVVTDSGGQFRITATVFGSARGRFHEAQYTRFPDLARYGNVNLTVRFPQALRTTLSACASEPGRVAIVAESQPCYRAVQTSVSLPILNLSFAAPDSWPARSKSRFESEIAVIGASLVRRQSKPARS